VDATDAEDAFCGPFLARILAGDSSEHAVRYASVAAGLTCTGYGAVALIPNATDGTSCTADLRNRAVPHDKREGNRLLLRAVSVT